MKEVIRYGFTLSVICILAGGLLSGVNALTKPKIAMGEQLEFEAGLKEVFPEAQRFEAVEQEGKILYYKAEDSAGQLMGVAFKAYGKGYSSTIETMAGMLKDGTITAIKVLAQEETPGLGTRVAESEFTAQFKNKSELNDIQAITGATVSSRAVIDSVKARAEEIKKLIIDK